MPTPTSRLAAALPLLLSLAPACAGDWSDTALGYRRGQHFAEPYAGNDIGKAIYSLTHAGSTRLGSQFLNLDLLQSDQRDPVDPGSSQGAREAYLVYRHTFDFTRLGGGNWVGGPVRSLGGTLGVDLNHKNDAGYNSRKRMLVAGPTLGFDVPGFLDLSLLALWESNAPRNDFTGTTTSRYTYRTHPMLSLAWGLPGQLGGQRFHFGGYANFIAAKGRDEFGARTAAETHADLSLLFEIGAPFGLRPDQLRLGPAYEYWRNKFGNDSRGPAGPGAWARTPMLRLEYHF
ncbi:MAG: hypothetical protein RIR00_1595 [Pseudomonadota bacterium]|jgi:hypothetical protein